MDILFLNRCYGPDSEATGQLLTELCADLARTHRITVIAGRPNSAGGRRHLPDQERQNGVRIIRVGNRRFDRSSFLGRVLGLASYFLLAAGKAFFRRRPDVVVVETDPPLLGALGALLKAWHRCSLVFYVQDLYPEVGLALGRLRPGLLTSCLHWATQLGLRQADRIIVLGEDMRQRVLQRGIDPAQVAIVPNWADTTMLRPLGQENSLRRQWGLNGHFTVMYSGNFGLTQDLDQILTVARRLRDEPVQFLLVGEGAAKPALMARAEQWSLSNVRFLPYQPRERLSESLAAADLHLVPLRRGLAGYVVPSKLYGILAAGAPYIATVDADSEVTRITRTARSGLLIEPDSPDQFLDALRWCLGHRAELRDMGCRGREVAVRLFDRQVALANFQRVLDEAIAQPLAERRHLRLASAFYRQAIPSH